MQKEIFLSDAKTNPPKSDARLSDWKWEGRKQGN